MPIFELTACRDIHRANGLHIDKGTPITITIPMMGITPNNLFNNSRCSTELQRQFQIHGIDVPLSDTGVYSSGAWDIKMR